MDIKKIKHFACVRDTGESIQGTKLKGTGTHVFYFIQINARTLAHARKREWAKYNILNH